ncbi:1-deoxy-D-xylulose 5-phosphate reductoisomerase [Nautilia profundicola AmH]|uniref:1-deoxy-D-xylulose 5-phosphate reductoisomerase n=1 Tax=Nautilia profundicola (strain ATCC BAA-1463 / DSM 18972 / AmH) TaxID=598659 RepID=DXR_NAUPA|nr:1-deoxy-D-xylulose-5-phosphate reductoisomerase [Nautilia profundicola]B9L7Q2.1 RecName: Full=1-deoxy-D-xylulose 5-phosphate reductoisomerase; Short=DXP reductoisomerase; AltName: Full=1-deoxyxylulose-5-phosphate reductoisomerase; AltName: Full=2-C-methyl-D-erythritol 4-phosphate synthase [Nautilia profundicola AmH]ACM93267.1 1-deoxy-D-xylulose 5-phosphate reductoisomerase [Nautilia profundicola AmH]
MVVLGSTGSIGVNTLEIARRYDIEIEGLVAGNNYEVLNAQIKEFKPKYVVVKDLKTAEKIDFPNVKYGEEAVLDMIEKSKSDLIVNALVGDAGLRPTLKAQECGKKIALANKESLVNAGKFIDTSKITPIDSEHFGLWYLLIEKCRVKSEKCNVKKLYITASGGALRDWSLEDIKKATLKDVLKHPNWSMGVKITIDSATMVNKLFELLEAKWLFDTDKIDAFIETKSIIHALVEWQDGSTTAHISKTDMKLPIAFAVLDEVNDEILSPVNLLEVGGLEFRKIEVEKYPVWEIKDLLLIKPDLGVVVNTANEFAIEKFLEERISFIDISGIILKAVQKFENVNINGIDDVFEIKNEVRKWCESNFV